MSSPSDSQAQKNAPSKVPREMLRLLLTVQNISSRINAISDPDQLLDELVRSLVERLDYANAVVLLADKGDLYLAASDHPLAPEIAERRYEISSEGTLGHIADLKSPLLVPNVDACDSYLPFSSEAHSAVLAPMHVGDRLVGILCVESSEPQPLGELDLSLMALLGNQSAASIEAARLYQEAQSKAAILDQRAHNLMLVNRISTSLNSSLDAYEIVNMTIQHLVEFSGADYGNAIFTEKSKRWGQVVAEYPTCELMNHRLPFLRSPSVQRILNAGNPYMVKEALDNPLLEPLQDYISSLDIRSLLLIPLVAQRQVIGILTLAARGRSLSFSDEQIEICQTVASQAAAAVSNARLLQDMQQQRRALTRKSQEMTEESSKLDAVLKNIADGLVVTDPAGRIILSNSVFREMAGLPPRRSLYGRLLVDIFPVSDLLPLVTQALKTPDQAVTDNLELSEDRVLRAASAAVIIPPPIMEPEKGERIAGVVTVLRDITHEVEIDRIKTDIIAAVSHEFRTPLTAILGFTKLIQRDLIRWVAPQVEEREKAGQMVQRILNNLRVIESESQRLSRLVDNLVDISKIETGQTDWPMGRLDLGNVIQKAVASTTALAEAKNLLIHVDIPSNGLPATRGNRERLTQVMTNLLSNAIKFTDEGYIKVSAFELEVLQDGMIQPEVPGLQSGMIPSGKWLMVRVSDTGVGIPSEKLAHIFERFTQAEDTILTDASGTGLGLSICKGIIEHHNGYMWVESESGQGSSFSFALPAMQPRGNGV